MTDIRGRTGFYYFNSRYYSKKPRFVLRKRKEKGQEKEKTELQLSLTLVSLSF